MLEALNTYLIGFLVWIKENKFYQYKDGNWYSTNERPYINGSQRNFYTDKELIELYQSEDNK